jgi:hypothetical protein
MLALDVKIRSSHQLWSGVESLSPGIDCQGALCLRSAMK